MDGTATVGIGPMIRREAQRLRAHVQGALELTDLESEGWLAYLTAPAYAHGGALRLRIRGAMRDALRREWRSLGRMSQGIRWPVYWPKTFHRPGQDTRSRMRVPYVVRRCLECRAPLERSNRKRCVPCAKAYKVRYERERLRSAATTRCCLDCQAPIERIGRRKRCISCVRARKSARQRERRHGVAAA
jgi:hypothetical protein